MRRKNRNGAAVYSFRASLARLLQSTHRSFESSGRFKKIETSASPALWLVRCDNALLAACDRARIERRRIPLCCSWESAVAGSSARQYRPVRYGNDQGIRDDSANGLPRSYPHTSHHRCRPEPRACGFRRRELSHSNGPGLSIYVNCLRAALPRRGRATLYGYRGRLLRQFDVRVVLRHARSRTARARTLRHA